MSSLYSDASLVMIPSGYKTSKVYSAVPTDGTGDLVFSRSNDTATRVGPDGLIEKVRTNLILQSQTFETASWGKTTATVTANTTTAPNGTTTADTFDATSNFGFLSQSPTLASGSLATYSVYVKNIDAPYVNLQIRTTVTAGLARFDFTGATLTSSTLTTGISASFTDVGSGWYRCTLTCTTSEANQQFRIQLPNSGDSVFVWGAMAEVGDVMTDYIATTTAAVSVGPVANVPRLDYLNSSCPRLLLEPQRTNSITSSESTATGWTFTNSSSAVNQTASPDGYVNADSIIPDATSGQHAINSANITASGSFTLSAFVKAGEYTKVAIRESANTGSYASFNLATGTKIEDNVSGASFIQSYGNGWYRIGVTGTYSGTIRLGINVLSNAYTTGNPSSGTTFFSGNASDKLFCWGMQTELGATYATSYIPTLAASVTRGADACSKTGISSLIGQTEGTLFLDAILTKNSTLGFLLQVSDGTQNNRVQISLDNSLAWQVTGSNLLGINGTFSFTDNTRLKMAFAYKSGDSAFYINGVKVTSLSEGSLNVPTALNRIDFGRNHTSAFPTSDQVNQALLFKTRLTNSQLASLTTL